MNIPPLPNGLQIMADQGFPNIRPLLLPVVQQGQQLPPRMRR